MIVYKSGVEENLTSVDGAVVICEVNNEQEVMRHDIDTLFRTPEVGLLPLSFCSTCKQQY